MEEEPFSFEHDSRLITGHGTSIYVPSYSFPHVLRLTLDDETRRDLPKHLIVKRESESNNPSLFDTEYMVYKQLQELQGKCIPICYGTTWVDGSRALILSDVGGITMMDDNMPLLEEKELIRKLRHPLEKIRRAGILLEDASPTNMLYCNGEFVAIDFEFVEVTEELEAADEDVDMQIKYLVDSYNFRQDAIRKGREEAARWKQAMSQASTMVV